MDENNAAMTAGTDYEVIATEPADGLNAANIVEFLKSVQVKFKKTGTVKAVTVDYTDETVADAEVAGTGSLVTIEAPVENVPVEKDMAELINIDTLLPAGGVKGEYTPDVDGTKTYAQVEIVKDGYKKGDEVSYNVKLHTGSLENVLGFFVGVQNPMLETLTSDNLVVNPNLGLDVQSGIKEIENNQAGVSFSSGSALPEIDKVLFTVTGTLKQDLTDYLDITLATACTLSVKKGSLPSDIEIGTDEFIAYGDKFGGTIPESAKAVEELNFDFKGADGSALNYTTDYVIEINGAEKTLDEVVAALSGATTTDDLSALLKTMTVVFKNPGNLTVSVKAEGDGAAKTETSETVTPKPPVTGDADSYISRLSKRYTSTVTSSSKSIKKTFKTLAGSTFMSALNRLQDSTLVNVTRADVGTGLKDIVINGEEASEAELERALKDCETVKDLYTLLNNSKSTAKITKKDTWEMDITFTDATNAENTKKVTVETSYKLDTTNSSGSGSSSSGSGSSSSDDEWDDLLLIPGMNTGTGGILTKVNAGFASGTVTPVKKANDQFNINVSGTSSSNVFDAVIAKVPYTLAGSEEDVVVVDKNGNVVVRSAYVGNGYVAAGIKNFGTSETYKIATRSKSFDDLGAGHAWAAKKISALAVRDIVKGVKAEGTLYDPDRAVTRAEFAKLVVTMLGVVDGGTTANFTDVAPSDWYSAPIAAAQALGIVTGYTDGSFGPNKTITRQEMCVMLARAAESMNVNLKNVNNASTYADDAYIGDWAKTAVYNMQVANVMNGVDGGNFDPANNATRAQAAVAIYNMLRASLNF